MKKLVVVKITRIQHKYSRSLYRANKNIYTITQSVNFKATFSAVTEGCLLSAQGPIMSVCVYLSLPVCGIQQKIPLSQLVILSWVLH